MIRRERQIMIHDDDIDDYNRGNVDRGASVGWGKASKQHTRRSKRSRR